MSRQRIASLLAVGVCLSFHATTAVAAAPPWAHLISFKSVEADPDKTYQVTADNGPWMIMATSFRGDGAEEQARELVLELRSKYKLPAYIHAERFDLRNVQAKGATPYVRSKRARYRHDEVYEIAVLVGNFDSIEDAEAQRTLKKLKYSRPKCLEVSSRPSTQILGEWRWTLNQAKDNEKGPMAKAFGTLNPKLPPDYLDRSGVSEEVVKWNQGVPHSLLDCPGKFSIQVATFKGDVFIKQDEIDAAKRGEKGKGKLAEAALKAHLLTEALRQKGWEAYEFHDRYASIVAVGSFDSMGTNMPDGRINLHPRIHRIMETFKGKPVSLPANAVGVALPMQPIIMFGSDKDPTNDIPLDVQPVPINVPKRSISRGLANGFARFQR